MTGDQHILDVQRVENGCHHACLRRRVETGRTAGTSVSQAHPNVTQTGALTLLRDNRKAAIPAGRNMSTP